MQLLTANPLVRPDVAGSVNAQRHLYESLLEGGFTDVMCDLLHGSQDLRDIEFSCDFLQRIICKFRVCLPSVVTLLFLYL